METRIFFESMLDEMIDFWMEFYKKNKDLKILIFHNKIYKYYH